MDKAFSSITIFTVIFSFAYFLIALSLVALSIKFIVSKYGELYEQILHGNVAAATLLSSVVVGLSLNLGFCITHKHNPLVFLILAFSSNFLLLTIYYLSFAKFKDVLVEVIVNNNLSISLFTSSLIISLGLVSGLTLP